MFKRIKCQKCLYHKEIVKFIVCPCMECKVYGGINPPITLASFVKKEKTNNLAKTDGRR